MITHFVDVTLQDKASVIGVIHVRLVRPALKYSNITVSTHIVTMSYQRATKLSLVFHILYGKKLWRQKTLMKFVIFDQFAKVFFYNI